MHHGMGRMGRYIGAMDDRATRQSITALYEHPSAAQDAATALVDAGFDRTTVRLQPGASEDVLRFERNQDPDLIHRGILPPDRAASLGFVAGFLGGGLFGLIMGTGALNLMGREPAMAVGPFWSAAIGAVVLGLAGAFAAYVMNVPLPKLQPPQGETLRHSFPTIVSVSTSAADAPRAKEALERSAPRSVTVWGTDGADWTPVAAG